MVSEAVSWKGWYAIPSKDPTTTGWALSADHDQFVSFHAGGYIHHFHRLIAAQTKCLTLLQFSLFSLFPQTHYPVREFPAVDPYISALIARMRGSSDQPIPECSVGNTNRLGKFTHYIQHRQQAWTLDNY